MLGHLAILAMDVPVLFIGVILLTALVFLGTPRGSAVLLPPRNPSTLLSRPPDFIFSSPLRLALADGIVHPKLF